MLCFRYFCSWNLKTFHSEQKLTAFNIHYTALIRVSDQFIKMHKREACLNNFMFFFRQKAGVKQQVEIFFHLCKSLIILEKLYSDYENFQKTDFYIMHIVKLIRYSTHLLISVSIIYVIHVFLFLHNIFNVKNKENKSK